MELTDAIRNRRSGRKYLSDPVLEENLNAIIDAALLAPSSRNLKSAEFITVRNKELLCTLSTVKKGGCGMLKDADCAVIVIGDSMRSDAWIEDASIAMTYMMLKATELGIGNCWVQCRNRYTDYPTHTASDTIIKDLFHIPDQYSVLAILSLGMPAEVLPPCTLTDTDRAKVHHESF